MVISDTLGAGLSGPWHDTTRAVPRADAHRTISELKQRVPRDILIFGSITLWHDLFAHGLVDELHLMIGAVILGGGAPALPSSPATLALNGTRRADGDNRVLLRYTVAAT